MVELKFVNSDATPKVSLIRCDRANIESIAAWYGSHHAGDRYTVYVDGERVSKDRNGELIP